MISAVANTTTTATYSAASSTSGTDEASLKSQLATKENELSQAKTDEEKASLESEISTLKTRIASAGLSATQSQESTSSSAKAGARQEAPWAQKFQTADKAAPESKFSSAAMDVLMRMPPMGGPGNASDIYAELDANDDNSMSKEEFVSGRGKGMSEEEAGKLFASMDTENKGSITKDQFGASMMQGGPAGRPPMGPPPSEMQKSSA